MSTDPDVEWVRKAQAGQKEAFGELVNRYYEMVYGLSFGILNHQEAAKDAAQEVFLKAFRELHKFEGKSKFKTWLYRITLNTAIDQARAKRPSQSLDATDASDEEDTTPVVILDQGAGPREAAFQNELQDLITQALQQLSAEHRAVLVLREWEGLGYEEIAELLKIQIGTVMSRLFYARKKLAEILTPYINSKERPGNV